MRIFHLATRADWDAAVASGRYTTSTRGRTLAEEGFIHASRADQWQGVRDRFYADVTEPLVLLVIDTDRLTAPVVEEQVADSAETFPHVYGAIEPSAVVQVLPVDDGRAQARSLGSLFLEELRVRATVGFLVMVVAVLVGAVVLALAGDLPALVTILGMLVAGAVVGTWWLKRREARLRA